jgi:hypothetical protein
VAPLDGLEGQLVEAELASRQLELGRAGIADVHPEQAVLVVEQLADALGPGVTGAAAGQEHAAAHRCPAREREHGVGPVLRDAELGSGVQRHARVRVSTTL